MHSRYGRTRFLHAKSVSNLLSKTLPSAINALASAPLAARPSNFSRLWSLMGSVVISTFFRLEQLVCGIGVDASAESSDLLPSF